MRKTKKAEMDSNPGPDDSLAGLVRLLPE